MLPNVAEEVARFTAAELKMLAAVKGPCLTAMIPMVPGPAAERVNRNPVRKVLREAGQLLAEKGVPHAGLEDAVDLDALFKDTRRDRSTLVILRSAELLRHYLVRDRMPESVRVAPHFFIRPLLSLLDEDRDFFLLSLSQKNTRLLHCTDRECRPVRLPKGVPASLDEAIQNNQPDHVLDNRSTAGPSIGAMKGVTFGTSADKERKDEYLRHFFRMLDRGVQEVLKAETSPLIVAGVEYELAIYERANTYPHTLDLLRGAPDGMKEEELLRRAREVAAKAWDQPVNEALADFDELRGRGKASINLKEILKAGADGRVDQLFVAEGAEHPGVFQEAVQRTHAHKHPQPGDEDLINVAVIHTVLTSGQVLQLPRDRMPEGAELAALMRFA